MVGLDITRLAKEAGSPIIILVEPQMAENIGTTARAMANFGLGRLRLVSPRDGWPNGRAYPAASGANRILDEAQVFASLEAAIADLTLVYATTARVHDQLKPVIGPREAVAAMAGPVAAGEAVGVIFGRERNGLLNEEVTLADAILTYPVNPDFSSLNLAQAVLVLGYEWFRSAHGEATPFRQPERSTPATKAQMTAFFAMLERELDRVEFFRPPEKRGAMVINLRNIFQRMGATRQDLATLHGAILAIAEGSKGPARSGGVDAAAAATLRAIVKETAEGRPVGTAPVRGLARLLRRNPIPAEKLVWEAMVRDRRFAGKGFRRSVPIGPHVADIVSFDLRVVIDFEPSGEDETGRNARADKRVWLVERGYRIIAVDAAAAEADVGAAIEAIAAADERLVS